MGSAIDKGPKTIWPSARANTAPPPKTPANIVRRPLALVPMEPIHDDARRAAAEREALYGDAA